MRVLYSTPDRQVTGSRYKYAALLQQRFPGPLVIGRGGELAAALESDTPDVVVLHGDQLDFWQTAHAAGVPYLLLEHDVASMRGSLDEAKIQREKRMIENASAVVFPSEDYRDYCADRYSVPDHEVVHLRPLASDVSFALDSARERGRSLVYAGGVLGRRQSGGSFGYRVMHDMFGAFLDAGWSVHVYATPVTMGCMPEYVAAGCTPHAPLPYPRLLRDMGRYSAGLLGYPVEHSTKESLWKAQTSRPNKAWDYLAAGIPTICIDAGEDVTRLVVEGGWGVECAMNTVSSVFERLPTITEEMRQEQVMDADLPKLERLLQAAAGA